MTLIEKQTRDKLRLHRSKCARMLKAPRYNQSLFDYHLRKANYYVGLLAEVDDLKNECELNAFEAEHC